MDKNTLELIFSLIPFQSINPRPVLYDNKWNNWLNVLLVCKQWYTSGKRVFDPSRNDNAALKWAVENNRVIALKSLLADERVNHLAYSRWALSLICESDKIDLLQCLLQHSRMDPSAHNNEALLYASLNRSKDIVNLLLNDQRVSSAPLDRVFQPICQFNFTEIAQIFAPHLSVDSKNNGLLVACRYGCIEMVNLLLNNLLVDPSSNDNGAIKQACESGHLSIVDILLNDSRVDPSASGNLPLIAAVSMGHKNIVKRLLKDDRVDPSYQSNSPIISACGISSSVGILKLLMNDKRVDRISARAQALDIARFNQQHKIVKYLLNMKEESTPVELDSVTKDQPKSGKRQKRTNEHLASNQSAKEQKKK